jgi:hypothetical protein
MWRRILCRALRDRRGQGLVEFALIVPAFLFVLFATIALVMAFQAKVVVTDAARNAGRLVSIECGLGNGNWYADAVNMVRNDLSDGALAVGPFQPFGGAVRPGQWYVRASCTGQGGTAWVQVQYAQLNLFPPMAAVLPLGQGPGPSGPLVFPLQVAVTYPVE